MFQNKITLEKEEYIVPKGRPKAKDMIKAKFDHVILPKRAAELMGVALPVNGPMFGTIPEIDVPCARSKKESFNYRTHT